MSRRATGFKYVPGRSASDLKQFDAFASTSCRSLTSLISKDSNNSSDGSMTPSRQFDSNLHQQPLSQSFRHHLGSRGEGVEQLQMMPRGGGGGVPVGGSGERNRARESTRRGNGGLPSMVWSKENVSVPQLVQDFSNAKRFPVIAKVTQGYYGDGRLKLPIGQVLQIHSTREELRVLASDGTGRQLSLPFSQVQAMDVWWKDSTTCPSNRPLGTTNNVGTNGSGFVKLGDVMREATLPVTVSVPKTSNVEDSSRWNDLSICSFPLGTQLTVQSIYKCTHLLANVIENGWLDSSSIVTIPEDLRPVFKVAQGLKGATDDEWKDFTGMFDRAARHIKFNAVKGYNGVIYEDWSEFSMTCDPEQDSNPSSPQSSGGPPPPLVEIERYLINKKQLPHSTPSSSSSLSSTSFSSPADNNNIDVNKRFPKTSPYLGRRRTVVGANSSNSSFSICLTPPPANGFVSTDSHSLSSLESVGTDRLSSKTLSGTSGTSGLAMDALLRNVNSETSEPDYANINDLDCARVAQTKGPTTAGGQHSSVLPNGRGTSSSNLQRKDVIVRVEDIALEDLSVAGQGVKCGPTTSDNRGTLISIDEGYSTKDSSRSSAASDAATLATPVKKRYSPVYF